MLKVSQFVFMPWEMETGGSQHLHVDTCWLNVTTYFMSYATKISVGTNFKRLHIYL
jgi:hypothetical protein